MKALLLQLFIVFISTLQFAQADQIAIETANGDVYSTSWNHLGRNFQPTPDYKERAELAKCLIALRHNVKVDALKRFFTFAASEQAAPLIKKLNFRVQILVDRGLPIYEGEIPDIQSILRWLETIKKSHDQNETRDVFMNFFNPNTTDSNCPTARLDYFALEQLPKYLDPEQFKEYFYPTKETN